MLLLTVRRGGGDGNKNFGVRVKKKEIAFYLAFTFFRLGEKVKSISNISPPNQCHQVTHANLALISCTYSHYVFPY